MFEVGYIGCYLHVIFNSKKFYVEHRLQCKMQLGKDFFFPVLLLLTPFTSQTFLILQVFSVSFSFYNIYWFYTQLGGRGQQPRIHHDYTRHKCYHSVVLSDLIQTGPTLNCQ